MYKRQNVYILLSDMICRILKISKIVENPSRAIYEEWGADAFYSKFCYTDPKEHEIVVARNGDGSEGATGQMV